MNAQPPNSPAQHAVPTLEQIAELETVDAGGARVLSVYLSPAGDGSGQRSLDLVFQDLIRSLGDGDGADATRDALRNEAARIGPLLADATTPGFAAFSCAAGALFQIHHLPVPVGNHIAFERKPDVGPLISLLDDYARYAVVLVDKARARLFTIRLGAIEEHQEMYEDIPQKHDQGGMSQSRLQRKHEEHVHWHLKDVVARLEAMGGERAFDRLVLAGPVEAVSEMRDLLPHPLAERLIEVTQLPFTAAEDEVLARTLEIAQRAEREQEQRVVEQLVEAAVHERGSRGVPATLRALYMGNVQTLVVAEGFHIPGVECTACGLLERLPLNKCEACGGIMERTHDIIHRAMARVIAQSGTVEVVHDGAAQPLANYDGLGAIFRFANPLTPGSMPAA